MARSNNPNRTVPFLPNLPAMNLLVFALGDQRFALPVSVVQETVAAVAVTPLPAAPAVVGGVIDVRGDVVPVYDLGVRFGREPRPVRASEHFVLADAGTRLVALRVDRVLEIVDIPVHDVTTTRPDDGRMKHVAGVVRLPDGMALLQDLSAFLSEAEATTLARALRDHTGKAGIVAGADRA